MINGRSLVKAAFARGILRALAPRLKVSEWADRFRVLSRISSNEFGRWSTKRTPYLREIMDCLSDDNPIQEVVFQKSGQIGGTETGNNWIGAHIHQNAGALMMILPTKSAARKASRTRIGPMLADTPALAGRIAPAKSRDAGNTTLMKEFGGGAGVLIFAGANSATDLKSQPAGKLFLDEIEEYPDDVDGQGDPEELATIRANTFTGARKKYKVSTPTIKGGRIDLAYSASDQRLYFVPCPNCGHAQALIFERLRWETRKVWERTDRETGEVALAEANAPGAVERDTGELLDVWYECESCSDPIYETAKSEMLEAGQWIPQNPGPDRAAGFKISSLYSPLGWVSWRQIVLAWLAAKKDLSGTKQKTFINSTLGEAYDEPGDVLDEHELKRRIEDWRTGEIVPAGALVLCAGVDVQGDRLECRVWGYGRKSESWLVDRHIIFGPPAAPETWTALERLLERTWIHELGGKLNIRAMAVDASDGNTTHFVRMFARKWAPTYRVIAIKGQAQQGKALLGSATLQDVNWKGQLIKGGVKLWQMGSDTGKAAFYARVRIQEPGPGYVHLGSGLPDEEFSQLTAEKCLTKYIRGFPRRQWTLPSGKRNEALDCRVMADMAAEYCGIRNIDFDKIEAGLRHEQKDLFVESDKGADVDRDAQAPRTDAAPPKKRTAPAPKNWISGGYFQN